MRSKIKLVKCKDFRNFASEAVCVG